MHREVNGRTPKAPLISFNKVTCQVQAGFLVITMTLYEEAEIGMSSGTVCFNEIAGWEHAEAIVVWTLNKE